MKRTVSRWLAAASGLFVALLAGCAATPSGTDPFAGFLARFAVHAGQAFEGRVAASAPASDPNPFANERLVMHVRSASAERVEVALHVGADRSRTWIFTRTPTGLRLKHDHRHADGTPDELTFYGGHTDAQNSAWRQLFPVDAQSRALFDRAGRSVSNTNVWTVEMASGRLFSYQLSRPGRLVRLEFDLTRPVPPPPPAWGW